MKKLVLVLTSCLFLGLTLASCASNPKNTVEAHSAITESETSTPEAKPELKK